MRYDSSAIKSDGRLVIDMAEDIAFLNPSEAPMVALIKRLRKEKATNPEFNWLERDLEARWDAINNAAGYANNATSIVVDNGTYFRAGMLVKVPRTGEVILVTAVATNTLTVKRQFGETVAAALNDNDPLLIIGNVNEEGAKAPSDAGGNPVKMFNYTGIVRTPFSVTNTANASKTYGGKLITQEQKQHGIEHRIDLERQFLFGERYEDLTGTHPKRSTRGLLKWISSNVYDAGGQLTETEFNNWLEGVFAKGSSKKLLLAAPRVISTIDSWGVGKLKTVSEANAKYGLHVTQYISSHGELNIVKEPLFEGSVYGGYATALDLENISYKYLERRDTALKTNIQDNDADGRRDEYLTEAGLMVQLPQTHGLLTGVTG
jgi:hypothetical protein